MDQADHVSYPVCLPGRAPPSPPSLVRHNSPATSFDRQISSKLHSNLVLRHPTKSPSQRKQGGNSAAPAPPSIAPALLIARTPPRATPPSGQQRENPSTMVVPGAKEKRRILDQYERTYGAGYPDSIITKKKGKLDDSLPLPRMRPALDKYYRVDTITLHNVITIVMRDYAAFAPTELSAIRQLDKDFAVFVPKVLEWLKVDFLPLREPRYDYEDQTRIDPRRVLMANAAMVHFGLDPGRFVRWLAGEYTGQYRDARSTLAAVRNLISVEDYQHMERILLHGCPAELKFDEPLDNKLEMIRRGNSKSFNENADLVLKTMNKEDRYSHLVPLDETMCRFSPHCRHTTQTMVIKKGKNDRLCWDGSTTMRPTDIVMNQITPLAKEAPITFGHVKMQMYIDIYNTRVSYPRSTMLLASADIKACFRFARVHADLTGAFGFLAGGYYNLATAMVFGSTASASSWEPFRRAIEALSVLYLDRPDLVEKHRKYLDMLSWGEMSEDLPTNLAPATPCAINTGVLDEHKTPIPRPARIYVDDSLLLALSKGHMELKLAALLEAIFVVMGAPNELVRQCPVALDKWISLIISPRQVMLGLVIDTNALTVGIPEEYIQEVRLLLHTTWHVHRKRFTVKEAQELTGKLGHLAEGATWIFHLLTHLYASIAYALSENKRLLQDSSAEFRTLVSSLKTGRFACSVKDQVRHTSFALKRSAKLVHHARYQYNINKTMRQEIEFFREQLAPTSEVRWEAPIAHIIPRMPTFTTFGDSCLEGAGGYSISLGFWWHLPFPDEIKSRTLLHKQNNADGQLISINVLEFVTVIINYCAALHLVLTENVTDDKYPVLLNVTDNTSALSWTTGPCRKSKLGRLLARFFCSLLINSPLGVNSQWICTSANVIADDISREKALQKTANSHPSFDYSTLQQRYPQLTHCRFFQPSPELISLIWDIILTERWPCHSATRTLRQKPLGSLITLHGAQS